MRRYCSQAAPGNLHSVVALVQSLKQVDPDGDVTVLCRTPGCEATLIAAVGSDATILSLQDLADHSDSAELSPSLLKENTDAAAAGLMTFILGRAKQNDYVTYLDPRIFFLSSPVALYEELRGASVGLLRRNDPWWAKKDRHQSYFDDGWICFRADAVGRAAAHWWLSKSLRQGDTPEPARPLETIFRRFPHAVEFDARRAKFAPWNTPRRAIGRGRDNALVVSNGQPLVSFDFREFQFLKDGIYLVHGLRYALTLSEVVKEELYRPYAARLEQIQHQLSRDYQSAHEYAPIISHSLPFKILARMLGLEVGARILFIAPLPPPMMGQAYASKVLLDSLGSKYEIDVIDLNKQGLGNAGQWYRRAFDVLAIAFRAHGHLRSAACIYLSLSQSFVGNLRDLLIFTLCFRKLSNTAVHLHGGAGMRELFKEGNPIRRTINRYFYSRIGAVVVLSQRFINVFSGIAPPDRMTVVPNFAPESLLIDETEIRRKFNEPGSLRVLFLSNFLPGKGYLELLNAYNALPEETRKCIQIDFAGAFETAGEEAAFIDAIGKNPAVRYHGVALNADKHELFQRAHVFCLPTYYRYEGQPISILEAYAAGCAVLTTGHSGIPDIFSDGYNGYQIEQRSISSIALALERAASDRDKLMLFALTNRSQVAQFGTKYFTQRLNNVLEALMFRTMKALPHTR